MSNIMTNYEMCYSSRCIRIEIHWIRIALELRNVEDSHATRRNGTQFQQLTSLLLKHLVNVSEKRNPEECHHEITQGNLKNLMAFENGEKIEK